MSDRFVTALIVTYNQGRFVEEAIESVLAQDFPAAEMEVVVVDDGSTDDTPGRAKRFGDRIRYVQKENGGEASALNLGLQLARGEIIALLEADDLWLSGKLQRVCDAFEKRPEAGMVYHPYEIWDMRTNIFRKDPHFAPLSGFVPARVADLLTYDVSGTSMLSFRRRFLEELLPIPPAFRTCVDAYLAHLIIFVAPVIVLEEVLAKYRKHGQNQSGYDESDIVRLERRWFYVSCNVREMRSWLQRRGYDLRRPDIAAHVRRWELWEQLCRFALESPGRTEFFAHLREHRKLYGPLWTWSYRVFKSAAAVAGLVLGYDRFKSVRDAYSRAAFLVGLRRRILPRYSDWPAATDRIARADRAVLW